MTQNNTEDYSGFGPDYDFNPSDTVPARVPAMSGPWHYAVIGGIASAASTSLARLWSVNPIQVTQEFLASLPIATLFTGGLALANRLVPHYPVNLRVGYALCLATIVGVPMRSLVVQALTENKTTIEHNNGSDTPFILRDAEEVTAPVTLPDNAVPFNPSYHRAVTVEEAARYMPVYP